MLLQSQSLSQSQSLRMNARMYQSIKIMEMPLAELREKIDEELARNPALEASEVRANPLSGAPTGDSVFAQARLRSTSAAAVAASDEQRSFIEGVLTERETLQDHLLRQLSLEPVDGELRALCELLIQNLDENGFHEEPVELLLKAQPAETIARALAVVQEFEPLGVCTRDYREALLVQARHLPNAPRGMELAVSHLERLQRGKLAEVAKAMKLTKKEIEVIFEEIKKLNPFPGRGFSGRFAHENTRYVVPDIQVARDGEEFMIILNDEQIPVLSLNPFFMKIADEERGENNQNTPDEKKITRAKNATAKRGSEKSARDFARENINEARWFIDSVNKRNHTLLRVCRVLVHFQREFFLRGPKFLAPLMIKEAADELGLHEATISRAASSKYVQTEWGVFPLRHFFSSALDVPHAPNKSNGARTSQNKNETQHSRTSVKEIIKEIILDERNENREGNHEERKRLSDQDVTDILAEKGIVLARRTVAKYRKELDLNSSFGR
jgi:RNA polymerase sigma-54 factor